MQQKGRSGLNIIMWGLRREKEQAGLGRSYHVLFISSGEGYSYLCLLLIPEQLGRELIILLSFGLYS